MVSAADRFVDCARAQIGKAYRWAQAGPDAFDCSGLSAYCYQQVTGRAITRSSHEQFHLGEPVHYVAELRPGDLLFWGNADHVGIFAGGDTVINALNEQKGVVASSLNANFGLPYLGARRIFAESPGNITEIITDTDAAPTITGSEPIGQRPEALRGVPPASEDGSSPSASTNRDRDRQRRKERDRARRRRRRG